MTFWINKSLNKSRRSFFIYNRHIFIEKYKIYTYNWFIN